MVEQSYENQKQALLSAKAVNLQFQPVKPMIDLSFWLAFTQTKLDTWKLDAPQVDIEGTITLPNNANLASDLIITGQSLTKQDKKVIGGLIQSPIKGLFVHTNTIEEFQALDMQAIYNEQAKLLEKEDDPVQANRFILFAFGDLKNYNFYYRFCMVNHALVCDQSFACQQLKANRLANYVSKEHIQGMSQTLLKHIQDAKNSEANTMQQIFAMKKGTDSSFEICELNWANLSDTENCFIFFFDSSPRLPSSLLSNHLAKLRHQMRDKDLALLKIVLVRDQLSMLSEKVTLSGSLYMEVRLQNTQGGQDTSNLVLNPLKLPLKQTKIALRDQMDPALVADNAVDLNLKLMKWRQVPEMDLDTLKTTSCLMLGSGSLGCQVARCLLSWGYRKITFVDNGKVSYSNPVRQCLFTFEDSKAQDNFKAPIAARRLKEIFPSVETRGERLSIPMPGHAVGDNPDIVRETLGEMERLEELIKEHDVIFLLLDSREARWLPTVMAQVHNKICLTVALGFDTFLVMRHGMQSLESQMIQPPRLGCYFCNDVVAPRNSLQDRTLDQQCTVSRPALCCMASSISVELLTSILNHPAGIRAEAREEPEKCDRSPLGIIPQQMRGDLHNFGIRAMYGEAFEKCTGCSKYVVEAFNNDKKQFLLNACNNADYLEDLTGITAMNANINYDDVESFDSFGDMDAEEEQIIT